MSEQDSNGTLQAENDALRKRLAEAEQQLRLYRSLVDQLPFGMYLYRLENPDDDHTLRMIAANPAVERLTGVAPESIIGRTLDESFPGLRSQGVPQAYTNVVRSGVPWEFETVYGDERVIESAFAVRAVPLPDNCLAVTFDNITQHKQVELEVRRLNAELEQKVTARTRELRRSQEVLQIANQRLRRFFEATPLATIEFGVDGIITRWNTSAERIFGWTAEEVLGRELLPLVVPPTAMEHVEGVLDALVSGTIVNSRNDNITKDGRIITCQWYNTVLRNEDDQVVGILSQTEDITQQVRQEQALRASEHLLTTILDAIPIPIFYKDAQGIYLGCNQMFGSAIVGKPPSEIIGKGVYDLFSHDLASIYYNADLALFRQGGTQVYETQLTYADGTRHTVVFHKSVFPGSDGQQGGIVGAVMDITERKRVEQELLIFKALVDNAPDALEVTTLDGQNIYGNPAFSTQFGLHTLEDGLTVMDIIAPEEYPRLQAEILPHTLEQGFWRGRLLHRHSNGTIFPVEAVKFVIRDKSGQPKYIAGILRDITAQVRQEQERVALQQQIIQVQQAALRELSTPLIPIARDLLVMPLIGSIDSTRAQQMMETLLEGVAHHQASVAILDITGVPVVDTQVANALIQSARAVKLLGAQVILTGIRPPMAQALVHLGTDLHGIITRSTLQTGIAYAFYNNGGKARPQRPLKE